MPLRSLHTLGTLLFPPALSPNQALTCHRKPETYERPTQPLDVVVKDITGEESKYTLDSHGFQIYHHESKEKDFLDDEKIKAEYYPEIDQLLKDAYVQWLSDIPCIFVS